MSYLSVVVLSFINALELPQASIAQYDMATCVLVCDYIFKLKPQTGDSRARCPALCDNYMEDNEVPGLGSSWNSYTNPILQSSRRSIQGRWSWVPDENDPMPNYHGAQPVPIWGNGWNPTLRQQFEEQRKKENANLNCDIRYTYKFYCAPKDPNWKPPPTTPVFHLQNQGNGAPPPRPPPRRHGQQSHGG